MVDKHFLLRVLGTTRTVFIPEQLLSARVKTWLTVPEISQDYQRPKQERRPAIELSSPALTELASTYARETVPESPAYDQ